MTKDYPLRWKGDAAVPYSAFDALLWKLTSEFAKHQLANPEVIKLPVSAWVTVRFDEGKPVEVTGFCQLRLQPDIPTFRSTDAQSAKRLIDRLRHNLQDQGWTGDTVHLHISESETEEQRCANWKEWLKTQDAVPAERVAIKI